MEFRPTRIIWHHSADASNLHQFDKINAYHKTKGFPRSSLGFHVGYHYVVEQDGSVKQARAEDEMGAHDTGENLTSIGICLAGDFNIFLPSETQSAAAALLVGQVRKRHDIKLTAIEPHRLDDSTDCPGKNLEDNWLVKEFLRRDSSALGHAFLWIGEYEKYL